MNATPHLYSCLLYPVLDGVSSKVLLIKGCVDLMFETGSRRLPDICTAASAPPVEGELA